MFIKHFPKFPILREKKKKIKKSYLKDKIKKCRYSSLNYYRPIKRNRVP